MRSSGNDLPRIEMEKTVDASVFSDFCCGIPKLDEFIHARLQHFMDTTTCVTYVGRMEGKAFILLSVGEGSLTLDDDNKDDMRQGFIDKPAVALKDSSYLKTTNFLSVEILYLAISKELQRQGIGQQIVTLIENNVRREQPDCQFLTVDAYVEKEYSAVPFYAKCGFDYAEYPHGGYKDTLRMYKVLSPVKR